MLQGYTAHMRTQYNFCKIAVVLLRRPFYVTSAPDSQDVLATTHYYNHHAKAKEVHVINAGKHGHETNVAMCSEPRAINKKRAANGNEPRCGARIEDSRSLNPPQR